MYVHVLGSVKAIVSVCDGDAAMKMTITTLPSWWKRWSHACVYMYVVAFCYLFHYFIPYLICIYAYMYIYN